MSNEKSPPPPADSVDSSTNGEGKAVVPGEPVPEVARPVVEGDRRGKSLTRKIRNYLN
jgi:hypothetical protein